MSDIEFTGSEAGDLSSKNGLPLRRVGIVIVNYNGMHFLPECLETVSRIDYSNYVVAVVDNASTDGSPEWVAAHYPEIALVRLGENSGFTGGSNAGMRWCLADACEYILLLNNDTTVEPDFLSRMMEQAALDRLVVPKIYFDQDRTLINNHVGEFDFWRGLHRDWFRSRPDTSASRRVQDVSMANGCALLIPAEAIRRIGLLDDAFFLYAEDIDFIIRALRQKMRIVFAPDAVIYHKESRSSGGSNSPLTVYYTTRNRLYLMRKHQKNPLALLFFALYFTLTRFAVAGNYLRRGQHTQLKAMWNGIIDFLRGKMGRMSESRYKT